MKWQRMDNYHLRSDAGYAVSRYWVRGVWRFMAWAPRLDKYTPNQIGGVFDACSEAKAACLQHHQQQESTHALPVMLE